MFRAMDISTSGLIAQRQRMNTLAGNIANINTTRDEHGNLSPFQRRLITFMADTSSESSKNGGVGVTYNVQIDTETAPRRVHDPGHPDADADGMVAMPNINLMTEFVNAVGASRAYEANIAAMEMTKTMFAQTLRILA